MTAEAVRRDALIVACAITAGIHAALAPGHFAERAGAGIAFAASAFALAGLAAVLTRTPYSALALVGATVLLAVLLVSYAAAVTVGLPLLHPDVEPVDGLAVATKAIEAAGLLLAATLLLRTKGTLA